MGRLALRRRTSGLWAAAGIIAKTKRSGTRIILRSEFILPELCIGRGFPLVVAQRLPVTAVSRYSDTGADFLCWRLIGPAKSFYTGQCPEWGARARLRKAVFFFRSKLTLPEGEGPASRSKL